MNPVPCSPVRSRAWLLAAGALLLLCAAHPALAQAAADAAVAAAPAEVKKSLFTRIMGGGTVFMGTLMLTSVFMFWLILDGLMRTRKAKLAPPALIARVRAALTDGDYVSATEAARSDDSPLGRVFFAGLSKVGRGSEATDDAIFEQIERERANFSSRISYLSVIGVITPMIGLTGTVFGMIKAFDTLGSAGVGDPGKLSAAIGTVLVATAGGLVVAIPAFAAYYILRNRISAAFRAVQIECNVVFHHLPYAELTGYHLDAEAFVAAPPRVAAE